MRCYHRFWHREAFTADKRRVKTWIWISALIALYLVYQFLLLSFGNQTNIITNQVTDTSQVTDSAYQVGSDPPVSAASPPIDPEKQRALIESFEFRPPLEAKQELQELSLAGLSAEQVQERLLEVSLGQSNITSESDVPAAAQPKQDNLIVDNSTKVASSSANTLTTVKGDQPAPLSVAPSSAAPLSISSLSDEKKEQLELVKVDINLFLDQWRRAWEEGDLNRYLSFYADNFLPANGDSRAEWESQRISRVSPERGINVNLSNIEIFFLQDQSTARAVFEQAYQARNYSDQSRKELMLTNKGNRWYIVGEQEI